jgi:hypothetical protein
LKKINKLDFVKSGADMTLTLKEIKIKDFKKWQEMKTDEDLKEVNEDITFNHKAQRAMQNRLTNRKTVQFGESEDLSLQETVQVTYHCMDLFMEMFDSHLDQFSESLHPKHNREMVFKAGEGAGRSGSFFFFSKNGKYIIKTMTRQELELYLSHLPKFCEHYRSNKHSILARIVGVFTINTEHLKEVHVMLMENTAQLNNPAKLTHLFDLKGSLVDRMTAGKTKPSTTLKDMNFLISCDKALVKNSQFVKF